VARLEWYLLKSSNGILKIRKRKHRGNSSTD
jgi:hypothetical protein